MDINHLAGLVKYQNQFYSGFRAASSDGNIIRMNTRCTSAAAAIYGAVVSARSLLYRNKILPVHEIPGVSVFSTGSLRCGGMGKTPVTIFLAQWLRDREISVAVIHRGYRGSREFTGGMVSDGENILLDVEEAGDEAHLLAESLPGVFVFCGSDRAGMIRLAAQAGARAAILDDGFQHMRVHRDVDMLLVHPDDVSDNARLLPGGPLREPFKAAERASVRAGILSDYDSKPPDMILFDIRAVSLEGTEDEAPVDSLAGRRVFAFSAIARPRRFENMLEKHGAVVAQHKIYRDHHAFSEDDVHYLAQQAIKSDADLTVCTQKDAVKIFNRLPWKGPELRALKIHAAPVHGMDYLEKALGQLCL